MEQFKKSKKTEYHPGRQRRQRESRVGLSSAILDLGVVTAAIS
jgi:hypothetical protein